MTTFIIPKKANQVGTFEMSGERFVVLKKEYLDELMALVKSFTVGEKLLHGKNTRTFSDFFASISKRRK